MDSSTGGVPSSSVLDIPKLPLWEGADLTLLGLDCCCPSPCLVLLRLRALLLLACTISHASMCILPSDADFDVVLKFEKTHIGKHTRCKFALCNASWTSQRNVCHEVNKLMGNLCIPAADKQMRKPRPGSVWQGMHFAAQRCCKLCAPSQVVSPRSWTTGKALVHKCIRLFLLSNFLVKTT